MATKTKIKQIIIDSDMITSIFDESLYANWSKDLLDKSTYDPNTNGHYTVEQLGINALPGTKFTIEDYENVKMKETVQLDTFQINNLGIFQLNVSEFPITHLHLDKASAELAVNSHYIIIDLIYKEATVNE